MMRFLGAVGLGGTFIIEHPPQTRKCAAESTHHSLLFIGEAGRLKGIHSCRLSSQENLGLKIRPNSPQNAPNNGVREPQTLGTTQDQLLTRM